MRRASVGPVLFCALAVSAPPAAASAPVTLHCGDTVSASVVLAADVTCPDGGTGLSAGADGITIDLHGHTVSAPTAAEGTGIDGNGHARVTVKGGTVRGFWIGIAV